VRYLRVVCCNPDCVKCGEEINKIEFDDGPEQEENIDIMWENWGQSSEDDKDYCPECGELGELVEEGEGP